MRKGKWVNRKRLLVLKMTQPQFARWLKEQTGIPVTSIMVARMENWGACDTNKKLTPYQEIIDLLTTLCRSPRE